MPPPLDFGSDSQSEKSSLKQNKRKHASPSGLEGRNPQSITNLNLEEDKKSDKSEQPGSKEDPNSKEAISEKSGEDGSEYDEEEGEDSQDEKVSKKSGLSVLKEESVEDEGRGIKVPAPGKDPFGLEEFNPK